MTDLHELGAALLGNDPNEIDDWDAVEEQFQDRYGVGLLEVEDLVGDLLNFIMPQVNGLSGDPYQFFARQDPQKPGVWIAMMKKPYKG